jgi:peptidoglycan-associated lipoprotein
MLVASAILLQTACGRKAAPVAPDSSPTPPVSTTAASRPTPPPPAPPLPPPLVPTELTPDEEFASLSLEELNRESPLEPVFFPLDSFDLDDRGRRVVENNVEVLRKYPDLVVTIEGHCDERGTAEYNLALGERRALAAEQYLTELGVKAERIRTVSYGKEFPFDPAHDDRGWAANRRAHFVITAK